MAKTNCWEFKKCGRQPGGNKAKEIGVCPAATEQKAHGINGGKNGGRACWAIASTFCGNKVQGSYSEKFGKCVTCEFMKKVRDEEGDKYVGGIQIQLKIKK